MMEFLFIPDSIEISSFAFLLCYITYLSICSKQFSWINRTLMVIVFCIYFFLRTGQGGMKPGIFLYIAIQSVNGYLEEKEERLKYYDLYRENKINENFKNLIKNIIPCGLFVCSKIVQQPTNNKNIVNKEQDQKVDTLKNGNKSAQNQTGQTTTSNRDNSSSQKQLTSLQINFANRQCMEDLGITSSQSIPTKIQQFKHLNKYQPTSNVNNLDRIPSHKSKFTNHDSFEQKKENTLNNILNEYLSAPIKDLMGNIEMNHQPDETYLSVPYEIGFSETRYFDIKLVNCQWDNTDACLCVLINISQKVINERKNRLEEYQKKMMSTITHNLKTPLNGIILLLQCLLQQQNQMPEDIYSTISDIYTNSELLLCMINDVIDYSKIQQGCFNLTQQKFNISNLLKEIKDLYNTQLQKKQLNLILDYENLCDYTFYTDYSRLKQILINLTGNALKFTFEGHIKIQVKETYVDPNIIEIQVTDTGNGISKHIKQSLLHKNTIHDHDKQKLDKQSGSGIGLNICQQLVEKLGPHSKLFIQSIEKQGTKVSFYLYRNFNRNRMSSIQNDYVARRQYKKQLSLKSQYLSFNTYKTDCNNSLEDNQQNSPKMSKGSEKLTQLNINGNSNQRDKKESIGLPIQKTQQLLTIENQISSFGSHLYSQEQNLQRKLSLFKEYNSNVFNNQNNDNCGDLLKESPNDFNDLNEGGEINHIASQNLQELRKYDQIKHKKSIEKKFISQSKLLEIKRLTLSKNDWIEKSLDIKSRRLTHSQTLPLDTEDETEEFAQKNQVKDDCNGVKSERKINNIYKLPSKVNRLGELNYLSQENPNQKVQSEYSTKNIISNDNIEFIKTDNSSPFEKKPFIQLLLSPTRKPQKFNLQNIQELGMFDEDSSARFSKYNKNKDCNKSDQCSVANHLSQRKIRLFDNNSMVTADMNNDSFEKINKIDSNYLNSPASIYSMLQVIHQDSGTKILTQRQENKSNYFNIYSDAYHSEQDQDIESQNNQRLDTIPIEQGNFGNGTQTYQQNEEGERQCKNTSFDQISNTGNQISNNRYTFKSHNNNLNNQYQDDQNGLLQESKLIFKIPIAQQKSDIKEDESSQLQNKFPNQLIGDIISPSSPHKLQKALSSTFQDGQYKNLNLIKLTQINSTNSLKVGNQNEEDEVNSIERNKKLLNLNQSNNTSSFNPLISNSSNNNKKKNDEQLYIAYLRQTMMGKKILIVDDTMFNVIALKALLQNLTQNKIQIDEAYNGRQAIQKVLQNDNLYDLILMDVNMPVMDGLQATESIKQINKANKIIIVTAFSDETDRTECINRGADGFLTKPVKIKDLATQVQNVNKLYYKHQENLNFKANNQKLKNNKMKENLVQSIRLSKLSTEKTKNDIKF